MRLESYGYTSAYFGHIRSCLCANDTDDKSLGELCARLYDEDRRANLTIDMDLLVDPLQAEGKNAC